MLLDAASPPALWLGVMRPLDGVVQSLPLAIGSCGLQRGKFQFHLRHRIVTPRPPHQRIDKGCTATLENQPPILCARLVGRCDRSARPEDASAQIGFERCRSERVGKPLCLGARPEDAVNLRRRELLGAKILYCFSLPMLGGVAQAVSLRPQRASAYRTSIRSTGASCRPR